MAEIDPQFQDKSEASETSNDSTQRIFEETQEAFAEGLNKTISFVQSNWKMILGVTTVLVAGGFIVRKQFFSKPRSSKGLNGSKRKGSAKMMMAAQAKTLKSKAQAARKSVH